MNWKWKIYKWDLSQIAFNTPRGRKSKFDEPIIRKTSVRHRIPLITTIPGLIAAVNGIESTIKDKLDVCSLQNLFNNQK